MRVCLLLLTLLFISPAFAQSTSDDAKKTILDMEQKLRTGDIAGQSAYAAKIATDNYLGETPVGETHKQDMLKSAEGQTIYERRIENIDVRFFGDTAIASGHWWKRAKLPQDGKVYEWSGFFQDVWVKQGEEWRLAASATAPLAIKAKLSKQ